MRRREELNQKRGKLLALKEEELPLSHKNNGDIINNDDTDLSLLPSVPPGPRNSKKEKRSRKKKAREKGLEEGEKEMEMESAKVSGGCGLAGPIGSCEVLP